MGLISNLVAAFTQIGNDVGQIVKTSTRTYATRAEASSSTIPAPVVSISVEGLLYRRDSNGTALQTADGQRWSPDGPMRLEHFGAIVRNDRSGAAVNAATIARAYAWAKSVGGTINYPEEALIYVSDHDGDGYGIVFDGSNVTHEGNGCTIQSTDPTKTLVVFGAIGLTASGNGRTWGERNVYRNLTFDGDADVQLCKNPSGEKGDAGGWEAVLSGTVQSIVGDTYGRHLRTVANAGDAGCCYELRTIPGRDYWVSMKVLGVSTAHFYFAPSSHRGLGGALVPAVSLSAVADRHGRVSRKFTATGTTTYIVLRANSQAPAGSILDFRDVYCYECRDETEGTAMALGNGQRGGLWVGCTFRNSRHYGFGMQNGGAIGNTFDSCSFEDTYMDGFDYKNNGDIGRGNILKGCRFLRNSLKENTNNPSAALDLAAGWQVSDVYFEQLACSGGAGSALRFKTGSNGFGSGRGTGGRKNSANGVRVRIVGEPKPSYAGFHAQHRDTSVVGLTVEGAGIGVQLSGENTTVDAFRLDAATGVLADTFSSSVGGSQSGTKSVLTNGHIDASSIAVSSRVQYLTLVGVDVSSADVGLDLTAGNVSLLGGSLLAPTPVRKTGAALNISNVHGYASRSSGSADVDTSTAGVKSVLLPHGLPYTPPTSWIAPVVRGGAVRAGMVGIASIRGADATNVEVDLRVLNPATGSCQLGFVYAGSPIP